MRRCLTTLIIVGLSIMLGCTNSRPSPITEQEVNKFIADHDIREVAVEIMGEIAVVLFNEDKATGYYMLYKDKDGNLQDQIVYGEAGENAPIVVMGSATRFPFVTVILNDEQILKSASSVAVTFDDQSVVRKELSENGAIIPYGNDAKGDMFYSNVAIYDAADNVIYSYPQ